METSSRHQKQKLTLTESHRLARNTFRQLPFLSKSPLKRFSLIGAGVVAGLGIPVLAIASQHTPSSDSKASSQAQSTDIHINSSTSSDTEEVFSTVEVDSEPAADSAAPNQAAESNSDVQVMINGEPVPLVDGSVSQTIISNGNSSQVDVNVSVDGSSTSSSSNKTDISIETSSSSTEDTNTTRGSPRR